MGSIKCGGHYRQFTNISADQSIGQAFSAALGNSSIALAVCSNGNLHLHVGILLCLHPFSVHYFLVEVLVQLIQLGASPLLSLFIRSIHSRCLTEKKGFGYFVMRWSRKLRNVWPSGIFLNCSSRFSAAK